MCVCVRMSIIVLYCIVLYSGLDFRMLSVGSADCVIAFACARLPKC